MTMTRYQDKAIQQLLLSVKNLSTNQGSASMTTTWLMESIRLTRAFKDPAYLLLDALRHGDRAEVEEQTAALHAATERANMSNTEDERHG